MLILDFALNTTSFAAFIVKLLFAFLKDLEQFNYELSVTDKVWKVLFPGKADAWHYIHVTRYRDTFYISHIDGNNWHLFIRANPRNIRP